jgi:hypothetical protein
MARLNNLQRCITEVLDDKVPGDFIETGVWRGGATIFMRAVLKAMDVTDRNVWVADSFEGLPAPDPQRFPVDRGTSFHNIEEFRVPIEQVKGNFSRYDLLDEQVNFLPGWFCDTLPSAPIEKLSILRLDADMYQSTYEALEYLYPKLSIGGYVIVDDYGLLKTCKQAVEDYRDKHCINEQLVWTDHTEVYWQRAE